MKLLLCAAAFISVGILARYVDAAERAKKPVVCSAYRVVASDVAVCSDAKKPFVMTRFVEVAAPGQDSGQVKVLVGWR
jgi:hypothetical protein